MPTATSARRPRRHDLVVVGASGFVGRQVVACLATHAEAAGLAWALAGRSREKLQAVRDRAGGEAARADLVIADAADPAALDQLARGTRVVLSTAGPFARHGSGLVEACVRHGTHHVDITGETPWVRGLVERHHGAAAAAGTRIVPCCGFDSVPSDLGAFLVARAAWQAFGQPCVRIKAAFRLRGGLNGGTLASLLNLLEEGRRREFEDPFLLNPPGTAPADRAAHADPIAPHRDPDFDDAWLGPFVMGPVNTRVVRRSAALLQATGDPAFDPPPAYQEYLRVGRGAPGALASAGLALAGNALMGALAYAPARRLASRLAPAPGEGPSEAAMDGGRFCCDLVGTTADGRRAHARIAGRGDPGNRATTRFVCESALALVHDLPRLPGGPGFGGVLTPATAFGDVLAGRLRRAGMTVRAAADD